MHGRAADGRAVEIYAGECRIEDGELCVRHSPLRAVNPLVLFVVVLVLGLSGVTAVTGWQFGRPGARVGWVNGVGFAALILGLALWTAARKDVLTDRSIPLASVRNVRVDEEQRRWYFKQRRTLPVVVVEYTENGRQREYPIRLSLHGNVTERELRAVVQLFEDEGLEVRDERKE